MLFIIVDVAAIFMAETQTDILMVEKPYQLFAIRIVS